MNEAENKFYKSANQLKKAIEEKDKEKGMLDYELMETKKESMMQKM